MRHWVWTVFTGLVVLSASTQAVAQQKYAIQTSSAGDIEATFTYSVQAPKLRAREWVLFFARPTDLPSQSNVQSQVEPLARATEELTALARPIWEVRIPARNAELEKEVAVRVTYQATLHARRLVLLAAGDKEPPVAPLSEKERETCLSASTHCDFRSDAFADWLKSQRLQRGNQESDLDFARRTLQAVRKTCTYKANPGIHAASAVCQARHSDCGGLSAVFVSALRANSIPARCLVGRWAQSATADAPQYHVKAEFYGEGVGWVPVEVSGAVSDQRRPGVEPYFGNDRGDFFTMHTDWDLTVDTIHFGKKPVSLLQIAAYWVTGAGNLEQSSTKEDWQVRKTARPDSSGTANAPTLRSQGTDLLRRGEYRAAIEVLGRAIQQDSTDYLAYNERGAAYTFLDKDAEAIRDFSRSIGLNDRFAIAFRNRGAAYLRQEKYTQALADFNRAIQIDPNYILAYRGRSAVQRKLGKAEEADADERQATKLQQAKEK